MNDEVAIIDQTTFEPLFDGVQFLKVKTTNTTSVMSHPVEDGSKVSDHVVFNLIEIEMSAILPITDKTAYSQIREYYKKSTLVSVQTRTDYYSNMVISAIPDDEDAEMFSSVAMGIKLTEFRAVVPVVVKAPKVSKAKKKKQTPKKDAGKKQPVAAKKPDEAKSSLAAVADYAKGLF